MLSRFRSRWWRVLSSGKEREDLISDPVPPVTLRWVYSDPCHCSGLALFTLKGVHFGVFFYWRWDTPIWSSLSFVLSLFSATVPKNNIFMPSSLCQSPTGNSDSEPGKNQQPFQSFSGEYKDLNLKRCLNQPWCVPRQVIFLSKPNFINQSEHRIFNMQLWRRVLDQCNSITVQ